MDLLRWMYCLRHSSARRKAARRDTMRARRSDPADLGEKEADFESPAKNRCATSKVVAPLDVRPESHADLFQGAGPAAVRWLDRW